jgi:hypothetical protein
MILMPLGARLGLFDSAQTLFEAVKPPIVLAGSFREAALERAKGKALAQVLSTFREHLSHQLEHELIR